MRSNLATGFIATELPLQASRIAQKREQLTPAEKLVGTDVLQPQERDSALSLAAMDALNRIGLARSIWDCHSATMGLVMPAST